jgi:hypothetical protein
VVVGRPLPGNRNDCKAWAESGAQDAVGATMTIADGDYLGTGLVMPHRRRKGEELPAWKVAYNKSHKQVQAHVEHVFARMKCWKILRHCRLRGDGVHHAMRAIARLHNLNLEDRRAVPARVHEDTERQGRVWREGPTTGSGPERRCRLLPGTMSQPQSTDVALS